jgi:hypothetical protein
MARRKRRGNKFFKGLGKGFQKLGRGIKKTAEKVGKGVKQGVTAVSDFGSKVGFVNQLPTPKEIRELEKRNKGKTTAGKFLSVFGDSATRTFKNLEAPAKLVKEIDPLRKTKLGDFSPISLAADIVTAPQQSIATIGRAIADKDRQKQLKSGNIDEIVNLALAPAAFIGTGVYSGAYQAGKSAVTGAKKEIVKQGTKYLAKIGTQKIAQSTATQAGRGLGQSAGRGTARVIRETVKNAPKIAGRFDESLKIVARPIQEIARSTKVPKQILTKAQRLAKAKEALKSGTRILKQF